MTEVSVSQKRSVVSCSKISAVVYKIASICDWVPLSVAAMKISWMYLIYHRMKMCESIFKENQAVVVVLRALWVFI